ncbi:copper homeostasis protein CutC [Yoonia sp. SS1-5]|uniref:PF03932 family protein CutC n=1 Tax=Yoonia rhodophyticola TaxID=3137370 RepID=A0AAN0NIX4_9RHOB
MIAGPILEVCVDSPDGLAAAISSGAGRIELCSALPLGGLTPGAGLMKAARQSGVPCHAMIRPRPGDFCLRDGDMDAMLADIAATHAAGLAGVVIGVGRVDGALDDDAMRRLVAAAAPLDVTLHRLIDLAPDPMRMIDQAVGLGMTRILTSGQASVAPDGIAMLQKMVTHADGRIEIMAGGGVTPAAAPALLATGVDALHGSFSTPDPADTDCGHIGIEMRRVTSAAQVRAMRAAMTQEAICA